MLFVIMNYNSVRKSYTQIKKFHSHKSATEIMKTTPTSHAFTYQEDEYGNKVMCMIMIDLTELL